MNHIEIAEGIYHIGSHLTLTGLVCNPYLLVDGDEAVLFDIGSVLDFEEVLSNLKKIIPLVQLKYVVLHHQDPDVCSSIGLLEDLDLDIKIVTSWKSKSLIQYYGTTSDYYVLEEHEFKLSLSSGRLLEFILTPYLHFAGAFTTYDEKTKILFSSDLFGALSYNHTTYADDMYLDKMLTFHELYMPSNSALRPVMDLLKRYDINMILPQHGSVIAKDVDMYIDALRTLECGKLLKPIKTSLIESGGYLVIYNDILTKYYSLYPHEEVYKLFKSVKELRFDDDHIEGYSGSPEDILNKIFNVIKDRKGMIWIATIEPYIRFLASAYDILIPIVFQSLIETTMKENKRLSEANLTLEHTINAVNEKLIKCSVTGLYNEVFLKSLLVDELENEDWREIGAFACVGIDDYSNYKLKYGVEEERNALNNIAYIFKENFGENVVFRLEATDFGIYIKGITREEIIDKLETTRITISKSDLFLGNIKVSIGVVFANEIKLDAASYELTIQHYMQLSLNRLRIAKLKGKNYVCYEGDTELEEVAKASVLVVDSDETNLEVIKTFVAELGIVVHTATDGYMALEKAELYKPNVIITEINLPKMDGFLLREELLSNSKLKSIETIYLSYQKDEDSVTRALSLGVLHYFKKPYLLTELLGIIKRIVKG